MNQVCILDLRPLKLRRLMLLQVRLANFLLWSLEFWSSHWIIWLCDMVEKSKHYAGIRYTQILSEVYLRFESILFSRVFLLRGYLFYSNPKAGNGATQNTKLLIMHCRQLLASSLQLCTVEKRHVSQWFKLSQIRNTCWQKDSNSSIFWECRSQARVGM